MPIADPALGMIVLILGLLFIIGGIIIAAVVYRESREWKKMMMPIFDMDFSGMVPEAFKEMREMMPWMMAFGKEIFSRILTYVDIAGLLGGAGIITVGILILLIGVFLGG
jgi:predicted transporter